jgi:sulfotransferase family protein
VSDRRTDPEAATATSTRVAGRLPNLVLGGVGKAGTTSLFWQLSQHPEICPSRVKEPRYFLALSTNDEVGTGTLPPLEGYTALFDRCGTERYAMDGTPHYFHGGRRLIDGLKRTLPDPRIVLTLRDPVDRVWSVFSFAKGMLQLPPQMTFDEYLDRCMALQRDHAPRPATGRAYWSIRGGVYADFLPDWLEAFPEDRLQVVLFDRFARDTRGTLRDLCGWLEIDTGYVDRVDLSVENRSAGYRNRIVHRLALAANSERLLRDRRRLKAPLRRAYEAINGKPRRERMPAEARARLRELFAPSNAAVAEMLRRRGATDLPPWLATPSSP